MKRIKRTKVHVCTHRGFFAALGHPSVWAGVAGVLITIGAELSKPYSIGCFLLSGVCSVIAIFIRTPEEERKEE